MAQVIAMRTAQTLGLLGLLPFFALALLAWLPETATIGAVPAPRFVQLALAGYTAAILSFLGAVHWGFALADEAMPAALQRRSLSWGVVPSLLGWTALLLLILGAAAWLVFALLIVDLWLVRLMDGALLRLRPAPGEDYLALRTRLTVGATLALAIALVGSI